MPRKLLAAIVAVACLACGGGVDMTAQPVPADKLDYVGQWEGGTVELAISADGMVAYEDSGPNASGSMTAPIVSWQDDGFTAGVSFLTMTFHVDEPPHEEDGAWKMTVDGVPLVRVEPGAAPMVEDTDLPLILAPPR